MAGRLTRARRGSGVRGLTASLEAERLREEVLRRADPRPADICVDLGAGTGFLTLPLSERVGLVLAVDPVHQLPADAGQNSAIVKQHAAELTSLALRRESVDLVVSAYALHRLQHADKREVVAWARRWLRPGGRAG